MTGTTKPTYDVETARAVGQNRRLHFRNGLAFAYRQEVDLAMRVDEDDPRYFAPKYDAQSVNPDDLADHAEATRQGIPAVNDDYAARAETLLQQAQTWLDDTNVKAKYGASNLLTYAAPLGPDGKREWRGPYKRLCREGDLAYQWPAPNGSGYVLIARDGQAVAIHRDIAMNEGRYLEVYPTQQ